MPPRKGSKKTTRKGKAAAKEDDGQEQDIPDSIPALASEVVSESVEKVAGVAKEVKDTVMEPVEEVASASKEFVEQINGDSTGMQVDGDSVPVSKITETVQEIAQAAGEFVDKMGNETQTKVSPEDRKRKMDELRKRLRESAQANRTAVIKEATSHKMTVREQARLEKQKQLAETLRSQAQAEEEGRDDDLERAKNWSYTIEENDAWEKKLKRKKGRSDFEFQNDEDQARKKYKKDLDLLKPDLVAYNKQKEAALGLAPGTLVKTGEGSSQLVPTSQQQQLAAANLYRDANSLLYADNKPSEEAIDRVVAKLNKDMHKRNTFSRKRNQDPDTELITYINEKNRVFNKKIARYYDKYTEEIRASFERGTAL